jgi:hypothetical protein
MSDAFIDDPGVVDILQPHAVQRCYVLLKGFTYPVTIAQINPQAAYAENN